MTLTLRKPPIAVIDRTIDRDLPRFDRGPGWMSDPTRGCAPQNLGDRPDLFISEDRKDLAKAQAVCRACPFLAECDAWATATGQQFLVWGGKVRSAGRKVSKQEASNGQLFADLRWHGTRVGELIDQGLSDVQIAARLGLTERRVAALRRRLATTAVTA